MEAIMERTSVASAVALVLSLVGAGCGGNGGNMMGPGPVGTGQTGAIFMSVSPQGGAAGVSVSTPIVMRFGAAMGNGMEQYSDLHVGDLAGQTVPMTCGWSGDRTTLTCTPQSPLASRTTYVIHIGGGMMTEAGQPVDYNTYGPMMGGQWIMGGMMGSSHSGSPWGMMAPGWRNASGSYGMAFTFTTA
jgi:hypothetical protein